MWQYLLPYNCIFPKSSLGSNEKEKDQSNISIKWNITFLNLKTFKSINMRSHMDQEFSNINTSPLRPRREDVSVLLLLLFAQLWCLSLEGPPTLVSFFVRWDDHPDDHRDRCTLRSTVERSVLFSRFMVTFMVTSAYIEAHTCSGPLPVQDVIVEQSVHLSRFMVHEWSFHLRYQSINQCR